MRSLSLREGKLGCRFLPFNRLLPLLVGLSPGSMGVGLFAHLPFCTPIVDAGARGRPGPGPPTRSGG